MVETWGEMPKSQIDEQKIEERITEMIAEHEADADAHQGAGESLESHKAAEVIDHPEKSLVADKYDDFSITPDKLAANKVYLEIDWQTLDTMGIDDCLGETFSNMLGQIAIELAASADNYANISLEFTDINANFTDKNPVFETIFRAEQTTSQEINFGIGIATNPTASFHIVNGNLYARTYAGGANHDTQIQGVDITAYHRYTIKHISGEKTLFLLDGQLAHEETTYFPTGSTPSVMYFNFENNSASIKSIIFLRSIFYQDF